MTKKDRWTPGCSTARAAGCTCSGEDSDGDVWLRAGCPVHTNPKSAQFVPLVLTAAGDVK